MIKGKPRQELTPRAILSKVSEYDIYKFYMPHDWELNRITFSPFREETNPSFLIGDRHGYLNFIDFADTDKRGNCFMFVQTLFGIENFHDVLMKIDKDMKLNIYAQSESGSYKDIVSKYKQPFIKSARSHFIQVKARAFTEEDLKYWKQFEFSEEELRENNIYSIREVYLNRKRMTVPSYELIFGYYYSGRWKIYRPLAKEKYLKWYPCNVPFTTTEGLENLKKDMPALITKSKKDYMVLRKIYPHTCAVQSENIGCFDESNLEFIRENSSHQIVAFDNDPPGIKNMEFIKAELGFSMLSPPENLFEQSITDWADWVKAKGYEPVREFINKNINLNNK